MSGISQKIFLKFSDSVLNPVLGIIRDVSTSISSQYSHVGNKSIAADIEHEKEFTTIMSGLMVVFAVTALYAVYYSTHRLYQILFCPLNRIRRLGSIGYLNHEAGDISKMELANLLRKRRKTGEGIPPVYPNGWFRLIDSVQLKRKDVKQVHALGQNFAVFRGESGKVAVVDAYCAHMGGNLGAGGRVKGDCIECPFHGWIYNQEGKCTEIPYSKKVPDFAKVKAWPSKEINGVVFVWFHCDDVEPQWDIPLIPEIKNGSFYYRGRVEHHANTHIQDIPENGSDIAHLSHLHVPSVFCGVNLAEQFDSWFNFADHIFRVKCQGSNEEEPHISRFGMTHHLHLFRKWKILNLLIDVEQIGPGIVHLHMKFPWCRAVLVQTLTPVGPLHQILIHSFYTEWSLPTWISKIALVIEALQVDRDVMVWNNKTFSARPLLVKEDAQIIKYRRWFSQFYSENSPKFQFKADHGNDW